MDKPISLIRYLYCPLKFVLILLIALPESVHSFGSLEELYKVARQRRILTGHQSAQPLYAEILRRNPGDLTVSTRLAASNGTALHCLQYACHPVDDRTILSLLKQWFKHSNFTKAGVHDVLKIQNSQVRAPIYVTPAAAGQVKDFPFSNPDTACILTALFLLGVAVPIDIAQSCCSEQELQLLFDSGLVTRCEYDDTLLLGVVMIMPMEVGASDNCLYIVTDWHPRVLNTVGIEMEDGTSEYAVMYIGPDSLALVQHWIMHPDLQAGDNLLDLCTGSGVQALAALATQQCRKAVCVDTSRRALRFASFSAALNGFSLTCVQGDLLTGKGKLWSNNNESNIPRNLTDVLLKASGSTDGYDLITANPPFLPVPEQQPVDSKVAETITARHGLFSAGGPRGENVLAKVMSLSSFLLKYNGYAGIVSEFFFPGENENIDSGKYLLQRLMLYWTKTRESKGLLLTNEFPISAFVYAQRRAETDEEVKIWEDHLRKQDIASCSPGLLYVHKVQNGSSWKHSVVPKSEYGSIWTPLNPDALHFTQETSREFFGLLAGNCPITK